MSKIIWKETDIGLRAFLRDQHGIDKPITWTPQPGSQEALISCPLPEVLYEGTRGGGKRVSFSTKVLTDTGWKEAGTITYGDRLVSIDGSFCKIQGIFQSEEDLPLHNVELYDGTVIEADLEHRWRVRDRWEWDKNEWKVKTTKEIARAPRRWVLPYLEGPVEGEVWEGFDPYMVGLVIADGCTSGGQVHICSEDEEILKYGHERHGWSIREYAKKTTPAKIIGAPSEQARVIIKVLGGHKTAKDKQVPAELLKADPATRLSLLQGLMDGNGTVRTGASSSYSSVSKQLAEDVTYLVRSLGGGARFSKRKVKSNFGGCGFSYLVQISHHNKFIPFRLKRKAEKCKPQVRHLTRGIRSISYSRNAPGVCFAVDHPSHCFVIEDFVVTHNTDTLLFDFAQHVGQGYGAEWQGIIFRRTFPELDDIINKSLKWFKQIWKEGDIEYNKQSHAWTWKTGESLKFRHFQKESDYWSYHGHAYPFIGWEELTTWPTSACYLKMFSCNRSTVKGIPLKVRSTTNPFGIGHNWVKSRWRLPIVGNSVVGPIIRDSRNLAGDIEPPRVAIHSHLQENKILLSADPTYISKLKSAASNPAELKAWIDGDWNIVAGGMLDDLWNPNVHVVPTFPYKLIPRGWRIDRSFDYGSSRPFSIGIWAESNGEPFRYNGKIYGAVPGDIYRIAEWYGWNGRENEGVKMLAGDIAQGLLDRIDDWGLTGRVRPGPADSSIFDDYEPNQSVAGDMKKKGVRWEAADKGPGSRRQGWLQVRKYLKDALPNVEGPREFPGLYICDCCTQFIRTVPVLPRDDKDLDDVDTESEDHVGDEVRYRLRRKKRGVKQGDA